MSGIRETLTRQVGAGVSSVGSVASGGQGLRPHTVRTQTLVFCWKFIIRKWSRTGMSGSPVSTTAGI